MQYVYDTQNRGEKAIFKTGNVEFNISSNILNINKAYTGKSILFNTEILASCESHDNKSLEITEILDHSTVYNINTENYIKLNILDSGMEQHNIINLGIDEVKPIRKKSIDRFDDRDKPNFPRKKCGEQSENHINQEKHPDAIGNISKINKQEEPSHFFNINECLSDTKRKIIKSDEPEDIDKKVQYNNSFHQEKIIEKQNRKISALQPHYATTNQYQSNLKRKSVDDVENTCIINTLHRCRDIDHCKQFENVVNHNSLPQGIKTTDGILYHFSIYDTNKTSPFEAPISFISNETTNKVKGDTAEKNCANNPKLL